MGLTQHGEHLYKLTRFAIMNLFLVKEEDGITVVDAGMPGSLKAIEDAAQSIGLPIKRFVLTHGHLDHTGSLDALAEAIPDLEIMMGERTAACIDGDLSLKPGEPQKAIKGGFPALKTKPTRLLQPGDEIGSLQVHASPGHTPGHLSYFNQRDETLIAGDSFKTQGGTNVIGEFSIWFPLPYFATWDQKTSLDS
ncbi:MAG: MBL fold metallo-hydrolase, partial [Chloroflexota bacterium]